MSIEAQRVLALRDELGIDLVRLGGRRSEWTQEDSNNVLTLRQKGLTIRDIAEVARCSEKTILEVLRGDR